MINVMLKIQFRRGKKTLVATEYTNQLRAVFRKDGIWLTGGDEPVKIASLSPEYAITWETKLVVSSTVNKAIHQALATILDNQEFDTSDRSLTVLWAWFDGCKVHLAPTAPDDYLAIKVGVGDCPSNGVAKVVSKSARTVHLMRTDIVNEYNTPYDHNNQAFTCGTVWTTNDEQTIATINRIVGAKVNKPAKEDDEPPTVYSSETQQHLCLQPLSDVVSGVFATPASYDSDSKYSLKGVLWSVGGVQFYQHLFGNPISAEAVGQLVGATVRANDCLAPLPEVHKWCTHVNRLEVSQPQTAQTTVSLWKIRHGQGRYLITMNRRGVAHLTGVMVNATAYMADGYIYYPSVPTSLNPGILSVLAQNKVVMAGQPAEMQPRAAKAGIFQTGDYGYGYGFGRGFSAPAINIAPVAGSRYSQVNIGLPTGQYSLYFLGSTPHDLAHCLYIETDQLFVNGGSQWYPLKDHHHKTEIFAWLALQLSKTIDVTIQSTWSMGAMVDIKHHGNQTHYTLNATSAAKTVSKQITVPFGCFLDTVAELKNLL